MLCLKDGCLREAKQLEAKQLEAKQAHLVSLSLCRCSKAVEAPQQQLTGDQGMSPGNLKHLVLLVLNARAQRQLLALLSSAACPVHRYYFL
jgi:hypothetical protein